MSLPSTRPTDTGPTAVSSNTHDFVHAMHLDIFHEYYPGFLIDWWLDNWISKIYGPARSFRLAEVKVRGVG